MTKKSPDQEAKRLRHNYRRRLQRLRWRSSAGDQKASVKMIQVLTEYHQALKDIGYRETDECDQGRSGRVVPITQEWIDAWLAKETKLDRMAREMRSITDYDEKVKALREYVLEMSRQYPDGIK